MVQNQYGMHEIIELRELLGSASVCASKSKLMQQFAQDPQLKSFLQQDVQSAKQQMMDIQGILQKVNL